MLKINDFIMSFRKRLSAEKGFWVPIMAATLVITTLYAVVFTGCTTTAAATPSVYLFTIRNAGNWLRVGYFGACFGEGEPLSKPLGCASTWAGSEGTIVAGMHLPSNSGDKSPAAILLVKYAKDIQKSALFPLLPVGGAVFFLFSAILFGKWKDSKPLRMPRRYNFFTFKLVYLSIAFSLGAIVQIYASVQGMATASGIVENPDFKIENNIIIVALQAVALVFQAGFAVIMWYRYRNQERYIIAKTDMCQMVAGDTTVPVDRGSTMTAENGIKLEL